jgi:ATP-dependent DNA helicase Q1
MEVDLTVSDDEALPPPHEQQRQQQLQQRVEPSIAMCGGGGGGDGRQTTLSGTSSQLRSAKSRLAGVRKELVTLRRQEESLAEQVRQLEDRLRSEKEAVLAAENQGSCDWECGSFPWDARVDRVLRSTFRLQDFRKLRDGQSQRSVVNATLQSHDVLVLMATGSGKSLCYQLPALCEDPPGVTLVVSPLKSLMHDQIMQLTELGVIAHTVTADTDKQEARDIMNKLAANEHPKPWFLYVTPERIAKSKTLLAKLTKAYQASCLRRIVCDECHCVAMDGMDFRPDYLKLAILRNAFPTVPILGCTATASQRDLDTVAKNLKLKGVVRFVGDFDRPNLRLRVLFKSENEKKHIDAIGALISSEHAGQSGIVYCLSRKDTEAHAKQLSESHGIVAQPFHAQLTDDSLKYIHENWRSGHITVVCATIAFGMGINTERCRFVIHSTMSKGLDCYWQEAGRAGRDGTSPSYCTIFSRGADLSRLSSMVCDSPHSDMQLKRLYEAFRYVLSPPNVCRRQALLQALCGGTTGTEAAVAACSRSGNCDVCARGKRTEAEDGDDVDGVAVDVGPWMRSLVQLLSQLRSNKVKVTLIKLVDFWKSGGATQTQTRSDCGGIAASPFSKPDSERVVAKAIVCGVLREHFEAGSYNYTSYIEVGETGLSLQGGGGAGLSLLGPMEVWMSTAAISVGGGAVKQQQQRKKGGVSTKRKEFPVVSHKGGSGGGAGVGGQLKAERRPAAVAPAAAAPVHTTCRKGAHWDCSICTFLNPPSNVRCTMCDDPRPVGGPAVDDRSGDARRGSQHDDDNELDFADDAFQTESTTISSGKRRKS